MNGLVQEGRGRAQACEVVEHTMAGAVHLAPQLLILTGLLHFFGSPQGGPLLLTQLERKLIKRMV